MGWDAERGGDDSTTRRTRKSLRPLRRVPGRDASRGVAGACGSFCLRHRRIRCPEVPRRRPRGGALAATLSLVALAVPLRTSLSRVPVQPTKFFAAMLLIGFGTYWIGEGLGYDWPTGGWSILWLPILWGLLMAAGALVLRRLEA